MVLKNEFICDKSAIDSYKKGWDLAISGFKTFLLIIIIGILIEIFGSFGDFFGKVIGNFFGILFGIFISAPLRIGSSWVF